MSAEPAWLARPLEQAVPAAAPRRRVFRAFARNRLALVGSTMLIALLLLAALVPVVSPYGASDIALTERHQPPSLHHPLGTDFYGRDVLVRLMDGLRISLAIAVVVTAIGLVVGVTVGILSAYYGGAVDMILMRLTDAFLAFPTLLFALAIMAVRGQGFENMVFALAVSGWMGFARLARAEGLKIRRLEYIEAIRVLGARSGRTILRHMLPNAISTIIVYATLALPIPILAEAALSFLGLGLPIDTPSLGNMISVERGYMRSAWWAVTFPGVAVAVTVLAFNFLGDGLRDALDPRLQP